MLRRFNPALLQASDLHKRWVGERIHEGYARAYEIVYAKDELLAGRNLFHSPLHEVIINYYFLYIKYTEFSH